MERSLTCDELASLIAGPADIALLDVRRRPAFDADPRLIAGAVWTNPEQVTNWATALDRKRSVVVYCVHGHEVSHGVRDRLLALGFEAALLEGGIEAWKASGRPLVHSSGGTEP